MLLKTSFLLRHLFCNVEFEFSWFHNTVQSSEFLFLKIEILLEFQKKTNIEIISFKLMHFGFVLGSLDIDLGNKYLLDTLLDLLGTNILSKPFVSLQSILKTSSGHVFKRSSRRPKCINFLSSKTSWKTSWRDFQVVFRDVFKTSSKCLQDILEDGKLLHWRCV